MLGRNSLDNNSSIYYAVYYCGHGIRVWLKDGTVTDDYIVSVTDSREIFCSGEMDIYPDYNPHILDLKLILKNPVDMNAKDKATYKSLCKKIECKEEKILVDTPFSLEFLLSKGYDAFDLIENGFALDVKLAHPKTSNF